MENDEFFKGLSDPEWVEAEAIEAEIVKDLRKGLSKDEALKFVRTVMAVRTTVPTATVGGVFQIALIKGLDYLGDERTLATLREPKRKSKVAGSRLK